MAKKITGHINYSCPRRSHAAAPWPGLAARREHHGFVNSFNATVRRAVEKGTTLPL